MTGFELQISGLEATALPTATQLLSRITYVFTSYFP